VTRRAPQVFFEAGAVDGLTNSNTLFFERTLGWTGVCVEPSPWSAAAPRAPRPAPPRSRAGRAPQSGGDRPREAEPEPPHGCGRHETLLALRPNCTSLRMALGGAGGGAIQRFVFGRGGNALCQQRGGLAAGMDAEGWARSLHPPTPRSCPPDRALHWSPGPQPPRCFGRQHPPGLRERGGGGRAERAARRAAARARAAAHRPDVARPGRRRAQRAPIVRAPDPPAASAPAQGCRRARAGAARCGGARARGARELLRGVLAAAWTGAV